MNYKNSGIARAAGSMAKWGKGSAYKKSGPVVKWAKKEGPGAKWAKKKGGFGV